MCIYTICSLIHIITGNFSCPAQSAKGFFWRFLGCFHSHLCTLLKIGPQRSCTGHKSKAVHIFMTSAVSPIHKPRFRSSAHFIQQASASQFRNPPAILLLKFLQQEFLCGLLKLCNRMGSASGTFLRRVTTEQTGSGTFADFHTLYMSTVFIKNIHIKETPNRQIIFYFHCYFFYLHSIAFYTIITYISRIFAITFLMQTFYSGTDKLMS